MILKFLVLNFWLLTSVVGANNLEITTKQGILRGQYTKTWKGRSIKGFTGIPFAKPPIGELRFKEPQPAESWTGVFDATKNDKACTQVNVFFNDFTVIGEEDCLYLNVFVPELTESHENLPVLFQIHGGGLTSGANYIYTPDFLLEEDIILVTTNYRLGALGFISTGDRIVPGNNGLKDQNLALRWTKSNIINFGGDPERITIYGESAGGLSVNFHMLSPLSKGLFRGVIATSGTAFGTWSLSTQGETIRNTEKLAEYVNCPTTSNEKIVKCLRNVDVKDIVSQDKKFLEWSIDPLLAYKPVIEPKHEGAFISEDPYDIMRTGKFSQVPFMTGITANDGAIKTAMLYNDSQLVEELYNRFKELAPLSLLYKETSPSVDTVTQKIKNFYFKNGKIDKEQLTNMFTDGWFLQGQDTAVQLHLKYSTQPVYYFLFGYRGSMSIADILTTDTDDYGVCHADDLLYLFNLHALMKDYKMAATDYEMVSVMIKLWANFVKTGEPTPKLVGHIQHKWEPVKSNDLEYYFIKSPKEMKMYKNMFRERRDFWRNLPLDTRGIWMKDEL